QPYKKSARIVGDCFVKDTMILTEEGLVSIQDVKRGDVVYTQRGCGRLSELYVMPPKELLRIELDNGTYNTVTPSQKIKVLNSDFKLEWKEANRLKSGDYIVVKSCYPDIKRKAKLRKTHFLNPGCLNENIAYLLGLFVSEGWIEKNKQRKDTYRISIACNSRQIIEKAADILMQEFDYLANIEKKRYVYQNAKAEEAVNYRYTLRINREYITKFFISNFKIAGLKAPTKQIPRQIFISPESVIYAFISGLVDGDGSVHNKRNTIHYGSVSEKLINQLQILLQHLGVFAEKYSDDNFKKIHFICGRRVKRRLPFHSLELGGVNAKLLASKISLCQQSKEARRTRIISQRLKKAAFEVVPYAGENIFAELTNKHIGGGWYKSASGEKFRAGIKYSAGSKIRYSKELRSLPLRKTQIIEWGIKEKLEKIKSPLYDFVNHIIKDNIYFIKVASITKAPSQTTYDIQVDGDHEFIANGMVSHNCLGKFHPHGDTAVYDALVRMVQDFSLRYPLIDGQGNFGSIDGDSAAAMRYTEARMSPISNEMLLDIERDTVNFSPNFDASLKEPVILPSVLPNLLINGSSGIAVGMATNIPPHNLGEVVDGIVYLLDNPDADVKQLMRLIKGPDFPTGGVICGKVGIKSAYSTGRGKLLVRGRAAIERQKNGKDLILINEIPYQVNKTSLIESIVGLVESKRVEGVSDIRDESDKDGMRIVIELKRGIEPQIILNQLYKHTQLETTYGTILLALVGGRPRVLTLKQILSEYIVHRKIVIRRRTQFDLDKALKRAHILEGLKIAIKFLDRIIKTIRASKNTSVAKAALMKNFKLSDLQAQAILEMQLQRLTALERDKLDAEYAEVLKKIELCRAILASEEKVENIIKEELSDLKKRFGDGRRTEIAAEREEIEVEDLIAEEDMVVTISHAGYVKRLSVSAYRKQRRGGKGSTAMGMRDEDFIEHLFVASTKDYLLVFTNKGKIYWLKAHEIPQAGRTSKGKAVVNLLEMSNDESISGVIPVKDFSPDKYLLMITKYGLIKKIDLAAFSKPRRAGIIALGLGKDDQLVDVQLTDGAGEILIATSQGKAIRFKDADVRDMGRGARGVRGIRLAKKDIVIGTALVRRDATVLTVTEHGFGKRTDFDEYRQQSRGGKGIINLKTTERNGNAVALKSVIDDDELIMITQSGMLVRCAIKDIRATGRSTQGVRLIRLSDKDKVACVARVVPEEEDKVEALRAKEEAARKEEGKAEEESAPGAVEIEQEEKESEENKVVETAKVEEAAKGKKEKPKEKTVSKRKIKRKR
ncbi:MAG TPA: DNA gyrase subunit A, partial [Candidatus Omnitrophica bacterium]|nr:DNA gyrase subunit A [Candidatus Omnitrophota bacterium]